MAIGRNADFEGNFQFNLTSIPSDSLLVSCLGYFTKTIFISKDSLSQTLLIQLKPSEIIIEEVKVYAGENPAFRIIRKAVEAKKENNYKKTDGFDYKIMIKLLTIFNTISQLYK